MSNNEMRSHGTVAFLEKELRYISHLIKQKAEKY